MANNPNVIKNLTHMGKGRKPGSKNKNTDLKQAVLYTFNKLGGEKAMYKWVEEKPKHKEIFYSQILVKVLPKDVNLGIDVGNIAERLIESRKRQSQIEGQGSFESKPMIEISNQGKMIIDQTVSQSVIEEIEQDEEEEVRGSWGSG